ncbi:uncharacterized protein LOC117178896 [Belonocnema kinseyi]|uniref:uncharacterized protein LOC117178896 n=1 Tax=Belonocnema kinseyi TaxID=2817044 RepID=UPI00143D977D|nr:uncharacterized protein LOC117178896 [Belonocnema kinseyi]
MSGLMNTLERKKLDAARLLACIAKIEDQEKRNSSLASEAYQTMMDHVEISQQLHEHLNRKRGEKEKIDLVLSRPPELKTFRTNKVDLSGLRLLVEKELQEIAALEKKNSLPGLSISKSENKT